MPKGLRKAKKYDWKDSNMALFGSDTEKQVKKESAMTEPAWQGAGADVGLKIWRIEQFEVKDWPEDRYGEFFNGDSYIILNTYKKEGSDELLYDVHFWIGKNSTQDEYGTVAYKTVELDTFLDDKAVQHREAQGHESNLFKSYFPELTTLEGGAESGFRHVEPETYEPRLLRFNGSKKHVTIREIALKKSLVGEKDVYIMDLGKKLIQLNNAGASMNEKSKAMQFVVKLKGERGDCDSEVIEEGSGCTEFYGVLSDDDPDDEDGDSDDEDEEGDKTLYRMNADGVFEEVKSGDVSVADFDSGDVFLLDTPGEVFVWIGSGASPDEKKNGLSRGHVYMQGRPKSSTTYCVLNEGQPCEAFQSAIAA